MPVILVIIVLSRQRLGFYINITSKRIATNNPSQLPTIMSKIFIIFLYFISISCMLNLYVFCYMLFVDAIHFVG